MELSLGNSCSAEFPWCCSTQIDESAVSLHQAIDNKFGYQRTVPHKKVLKVMKQLALVTRKTMEHFVTKQIFERLDMLKTFQTGKKKRIWLTVAQPLSPFNDISLSVSWQNSLIHFRKRGQKTPIKSGMFWTYSKARRQGCSECSRVNSKTVNSWSTLNPCHSSLIFFYFLHV